MAVALLHDDMDKRRILDEIRRTADANGGTPLGKFRLDREAGIKEHHWKRIGLA